MTVRATAELRLVQISRAGTPLETIVDAPAVLSQVLEATAALYARKGFEPPWVGYAALEGPTCVGTCGFNGPPTAEGVEMAYYTFPEHEGRGVATRMARALLALAHGHPGLRPCVYAHTLAEENASTSILRKLGFQLEGEFLHPEDGKVWKWRAALIPEAGAT